MQILHDFDALSEEGELTKIATAYKASGYSDKCNHADSEKAQTSVFQNPS